MSEIPNAAPIAEVRAESEATLAVTQPKGEKEGSSRTQET